MQAAVTTIANQLAMLRLASPSLPIGGFSYSQGLESAIERQWVTDAASLANWLEDALDMNVGRYEAPLALALFEAVTRGDDSLAHALHADFLATRESAELRAETCQMGYSLLRMLATLDDADRRGVQGAAALLAAGGDCALPMAWAQAALAFGLKPADALAAWLWTWLENQVAAAIKAVPLGQQAGQRVLDRLQPALARVVDEAGKAGPEEWSNFAPGFAMASSWHETQYSRLFRS